MAGHDPAALDRVVSVVVISYQIPRVRVTGTDAQNTAELPRSG